MSTLIDSYGTSNKDTDAAVQGTTPGRFGQCLTTTTPYLFTSIKFYLSKYGYPTGLLHYAIRAVSGSVGTTAIATGAELAATGTLNVTTLSAQPGYALYELTFASPYSAPAGDYALEIIYTGGDTNNYVVPGCDTSAPSHPGNAFAASGAIPTYDACFYLYGNSADITATADITLSMWTITAGADGAMITAPSFSCVGDLVNAVPTGANLIAPMWICEGTTPAIVESDLVVPMWTCEGTIISTAINAGDITTPIWRCTGTAISGQVGTLDIKAPLWTCNGTMASVGSMTVPFWTCSGEAITGEVIDGNIDIPMWDCTGSVIRGNNGTCDVILPAITVNGFIYNAAVITANIIQPAWVCHGVCSTGRTGNANLIAPMWSCNGVAIRNNNITGSGTLPCWKCEAYVL